MSYKKRVTMIAPSFSRIALLATTLALAGCGKPEARKPSAAHPLPKSPLISKGEPGRMGGRFVIPASASPKTFNPLFAFDGASDGIIRLLFASLANLDWASQQPGPGLAESWSVAPDQKTWTFKLRAGTRWSDGEPLTADDVVFTWNEIICNRALKQTTLDPFRINGREFAVTKVDEYTVQVVTSEVFAPFVEFFGGVPVLPKHVLEIAVKAEVLPAAYGLTSKPDRIVGCGPYRLKEFRLGQFTLLERNPEYWVADRQGARLPYFDEVMFTVRSGSGGEAALFLSGKGDVFDAVRPQNYPAFKQASMDGRFQLLDLGPGADREFVWFNQNTGTNAAGKPFVNPVKLKWFRDRKFRQAVSCAIDRDRLVREAYGGRAQPAYGFLSAENQRWNNPDIPRYGYDVARARALLAEIGMQDRNGDGAVEDAAGNLVEIEFSSNLGNPLREKAAVLIQEDLKRIGLKLIYVPMEYRALLDRINVTFDYECALMGLGGGGSDPVSQMNVLRSSEELHQWFPFQKTPSTAWEAHIDALMDAQMRTLDFAQRKKAFDEVQVILAEEQPMIYTVTPFVAGAIRAGVGNLRPSVLSPNHLTWNLEELYFKGK
ncbi:MAG TPA: ABC transporter substrate-binding protein [Candidatus Paceibacterota bacterium]|nr:ABC transporter substrate-binding protein [Verrucomicrobiota bacterium]HSA10681.1 ABC transporter substrate-binding protein [Candidatus Paceibacterota bacterium]